QALAEQTEDAELAKTFAPLAKSLAENEATIVAELSEAQGHPADIGGYYAPDPAKTTAVMRPSKTFNAALEKVLSGK
ncbi:MAG: NADP-dependent isocitrate dehydrogenase, partial [Mycolicibacterium sp.]|nr:NADP-dependent isocitrate dehydrogenase [Mycolicibacterium sp.]